MTYLLALHLLMAVLCVALAPHLGSRTFAVAALAPGTGFVWLLTQAPDVVSGQQVRAELPWAAALQLAVPLRLDTLALLLALLVTGVGAVVLAYSVRYFAERDHGIGRTAAVMVLFAGSMLALVLADHLLALYVAWELTTVCSFLLIGDDGRSAQARRAAMRALMVTTGTGFAMLFGLVLLGEQAGSYRISTILDDPPQGGVTATAITLILVGVLGKSAQVPLHPWLPAAMVAATPVSAYLHAAAMVKAGLYLVARLAPAFADVVTWKPVLLTAGVATMLLGGWRALAQTDLKRLLAFGTIAQLGFILVLLAAGTRTAALAGAAMLLAHGLFKSTLFLVVGVIDHEAGTRDLRELSGVRRRAPALAVLAVLACASMAGLPPTLGYLGKEAALTAFVAPAPGGLWVLAGLTVGSVLTIAYTLRFLWGAFADRPGVAVRMQRAPMSSVVPTAAVALAGVAAGCYPHGVDVLASGYASAYPAVGGSYHLSLWHGLTTPLLLSLLTLTAGTALHLARGPLAAARGRIPATPAAQTGQDRAAAILVTGARRFTGLTQVGSLPTYLVVILAAVAAGPGMMLLLRVGVPTDVRLWDTPSQAVVVAGLTAAVVGAVAARRRLTAVILVSAAGYLVAALFVIHGAPDLALTQVLVETLTLLLFVLVLRRMPRGMRVAPAPLRALGVVVSGIVGVFATLVTLAVGARHAPSRSAQGYFRRAPEAGGTDVVSVILSKFRALDTLGEVTVLALAATGVASLVLVSGRMGRPPRPGDPQPAPDQAEAQP
ncbi:MAG TPA: hydrogen gas-evolving membrane-bound hydrogenase subunit E [Nocardioidaceae bacterium]|nr:hydrogen gas-evolving membrane-bound hydrogenase subunit E [Nocardioidaceae bacterium]